ncbi:putative type I restriction enzymeP M protein [Salinivirga cyanobacteriivorans]|uniref:Putative type I restriction enzymeP M protein n=1 Tax=Salinivirga cyanobacteriivorans TaxID=1307839 RepID=A0A0S2I3E3_9BACT|nr:N-6 DNA methylase [Salinivirga cyanobacteriivorans]ALO16815.1 putative type I restriction enzymeP M protein [Salinivirga cyanobacteriivorans]
MDIQIENGKIFAPLKEKWLMLKPEEEVRQKYIARLVVKYGFSIDQMAQEVQVSNSQRGQGRAMADIVIWKSSKDKNENNSPAIVVECKAEHITVREEDYFQGYNYASWAGADFFVTTNLKETRIFKVLKGKIPKKLEEVINIPDAETINNSKKVGELLKQTKAFTRDEFSKLLFKCHNIIRNNDKLSPEAAFDEISKILFIKIRYERDNTGAQIFSEKEFKAARESYEKFRPKDGAEFYQFLFQQTKEDFKDDDLFDPNEVIRIRENSFEAIVKELEIYNLSTTSDDVKGIAFEKFLGKTFRGELGQFFTPRTIVDFMVDVLDPQEGEVLCDPCCGSGGFLIRAFEYVREKIENEIQEAKEKIKKDTFTKEYENLLEDEKGIIDEKVNEQFTTLNFELDINNPNSRLRRLSFDCIFGTDANPRMSRTAKMNMIMHGDGHGGVHHNDGLLNVNGVFDNRFDIILTNPPFGSRVEKNWKITEADKYTDIERIRKYQKRYGKAYDKALEQVNKNIGKPLLSLFKTGSMSTLTEVLFIERCLNLLKPGGRMGIVLPEGVLNNTNLQRVRDFVESQAKIILITSIPQDVFIASGATVKPSLLFFRKFTEEEAKEWKRIAQNAKNEINAKYSTQIKPIEEKLALRGKEAPTNVEKKELRKQLKEIQEKIESEIKAKIKKDFDYRIPIAEVEKAGISTTGAEIENELIPLSKEFTEYRKQNQLWENKFDAIKYEVMEDGKMFRIPTVGEPQEIYG